MTPALVLALLLPGARTFAAPAAQPPDPSDRPTLDDLGIPAAPPWEEPVETEFGPGGKAKGRAQAKQHPLEIRFWERLESDLAFLERWRTGLLQGAWFAAGQPQAFQPAGDQALYDEYRDMARKTWLRSMDYWMALDSLVARYGEYRELSGEAERDAAFVTAYAAYLAQARFMREWTGLCGGRVVLEQLFDEPVPELGLGPGSYARLKGRFQGKAGAGDRSAAWRSYERLGRGRSVARVKGVSREPWERARAEDAAVPRKGAKPAGKGKEPGRELLSGSFRPLLSAAEEWPEGTDPAEEQVVPLMLPPMKDWATVTVSSQITHAVETVRHWLRMDASTGTRPMALITKTQAADLARELEPGDILLGRRERHVTDVGLPGYWHLAGLYVGLPAERAKYFGSTDLDAVLKRVTSAAYAANAGSSPAPTGSRPKGRVEPGAPVMEARPGGAGFSGLAGFSALDALAVLRPRLGPREKGEALQRAFACFGRPYDYRFDARSDAALSGAEFVAQAYQGTRTSPGLRIPLEEYVGLWTASVNALARKFDAEFGTKAQELDFVVFLDEDGDARGAHRSSLEEFRRSWRRPKGALLEEGMR